MKSLSSFAFSIPLFGWGRRCLTGCVLLCASSCALRSNIEKPLPHIATIGFIGGVGIDDRWKGNARTAKERRELPFLEDLRSLDS